MDSPRVLMDGPRVLVIGAAAHVFPLHHPGLDAIGARVVGVQDVNEERLRPVAEAFGCPAFGEVASLLRTPADLAVIVAPHPFHAEYAIACLRAGLHVLVEKPIAVEVAEADRMVAEAERAGRLLCVAFQHRTRTEIQEARRLIQSGALGEIQRADLLATWPRRTSYFATAPWRGSWRGEGGGIVINQGQHDLDLLGYLAGRPRRVVAWRRAQIHPIETEDTISGMVEYPSGAVGFIHISTAEADEAQRIEITGTGGRLRVTKGRLEVIRLDADFREYAASPGNPYAGPTTLEPVRYEGMAGRHVDVYRDLAGALAGAHPPMAPGDSATLTLELANALTLSSVTGEEVRVPLDRDAYHDLLTALRARRGVRA